MGREIHDTLLQGLIGVSLQVDDLASKVESSPHSAQQQLERLRRQVVEYIRETRQSIWDLRSPSLETLELADALRRAGENITGSRVRFEFVPSGTPRRGSPTTEEQLLKIGHEALVNAVRHARARSIRMELHYERESVALRVVDDGVGFEPKPSGQPPEKHWGLLGMRERAQHIGGQCRIISRPGHGTEVEAIVPLGKPAGVQVH